MFAFRIMGLSKGHLKFYKRTERGLKRKGRKRTDGQRFIFKRSQGTLQT